mmetsp:Transcript_2861/g.6037  ORF Transcript_2861/g.6037 Transcript_2861/m.6037 type:complete len:96 (+) Transcript_2861:490-777(+)
MKAVEEAEDKALKYIQELLEKEEMKALLLEVVGCLTGFKLSARFLKELMSLMVKYGGHLVVDEIMTAGRVGDKFLASESWGITPHYVTLGKSRRL